MSDSYTTFKEIYKNYDFEKLFGPTLEQLYENSMLLEYIESYEKKKT
jgi:hypothetical protein